MTDLQATEKIHNYSASPVKLNCNLKKINKKNFHRSAKAFLRTCFFHTTKIDKAIVFVGKKHISFNIYIFYDITNSSKRLRLFS